MYNEKFRTLQKDTELFFSYVSNGKAKMNLYRNLPVYSLTCMWKYIHQVLT